MARRVAATVLLAVVCSIQMAASATAADAGCGAAMQPCGMSLPASSPCAKNRGYCQPGYYCSSCKGFGDFCKDTRSLCRPVQKNCGTKASDPKAATDYSQGPPDFSKDPTNCCPNNAVKPLTAEDEKKLFMAPTCGAGLTCSFGTQGPWHHHPEDPYAAPLYSTGIVGTCYKVPADCGSAGKACCPNPYHTGFNPAPRTFMCWQGQDTTSQYCDGLSGTCKKNPSNCGTLGNPCCISDAGSTTNVKCMADMGTGKGYYCTAPTAQKPSMCTKCPSDWKTRFPKDSYEAWQCGL